jgi:hypothetical protein
MFLRPARMLESEVPDAQAARPTCRGTRPAQAGLQDYHNLNGGAGAGQAAGAARAFCQYQHSTRRLIWRCRGSCCCCCRQEALSVDREAAAAAGGGDGADAGCRGRKTRGVRDGLGAALDSSANSRSPQSPMTTKDQGASPSSLALDLRG